MTSKTSRDIRRQFIDFFQERGHSVVPSSSVVLRDDPTLLFANAGMNQFKGIFLGTDNPKSPRAVNSQKCIRVSGKHNDLEDVGLDTFHHTFFEMLGNWSFGDYYKEEAIRWAWELLTGVWEMDRNRLWVTVFEDDAESEKVWRHGAGLPAERILKFGRDHNFWEMGETGPCGPCSEIHYYIGRDPSRQKPELVNRSPECWELWNLVFIQNNRLGNGSLELLPQKHVDTGAGLERLSVVLQGVDGNYDTDLFQPIIRRIELESNRRFSDHPVAHRAIADHVRMLSIAVADGVLPSNEGRGYVLRRILRRAARFGRELGLRDPFLHRIAGTVSDSLGEIYPELKERAVHIERVLLAEENSFNETLDRGIEQFEKIVKDLSGAMIPGDAAFRLYDTFGFPLDLTEQMARERGMTLDSAGFRAAMQAQRTRARAGSKFRTEESDAKWTLLTEGPDSEFLGYQTTASAAVIRRYRMEEGRVAVVLDKTPFYGEQGGQVGDTGTITGEGFLIHVTDTVKEGSAHLHIGKLVGSAISSPNVTAEVDGVRRQKIRLNHTATHLLHKALKIVLGEHVQQAGSLVGPDYLRFDLTHYAPVAPDELHKIEEEVNREIRKNTPLVIDQKPYEEARREGAVAIFEEKYGDVVRVIQIGDYSKELCGGTHVDRTGDIGFFLIIEEASLAAGVRRIVALTGPGAEARISAMSAALAAARSLLNCGESELYGRIEKLVEQKKRLEKESKRKEKGGTDDRLGRLLESGEAIGTSTAVVGTSEASDEEDLRTLGESLSRSISSGVVVVAALIDSRVAVVCAVTDNLVKKGVKAGELAKQCGMVLGGGGGGKSHLAMAGGKAEALTPATLNNVRAAVVEAVTKAHG